MNNWFDHIMFHARVNPEKPAIVMEDRVVTYGMLRTGIERCARRVIALNIPRDGLVAVVVKNPIRHLTLCLALIRVGIPSITLARNQSGVETVEFSSVLCDRGDGPAMAGSGHRIVEVSDEWFSVDLPDGEAVPPGFSASTDVCRVSLTSGSTGAPKRVDHRVQDYGWRVLKFLDVNWSFALCMPGLASNWGFATSCAALTTGRTLCYAETPFQAIRMIELFSIDFVMATSEQLLAMTRAARKSGARLASLRNVWTGGTAPTRALLEAATAHLCKDILCYYGASETSILAQALARDVLAQPGLAGHVRPGVEIAVFDPRGGIRPSGQVGALRVRLREGYGGPPQGASSTDQPWIDLGDLGWMTPAGQLFIVGRASDLRATGRDGTPAPQISPVQEVEDLLRLEWDATDAAAVFADDASGPQIWIGIVDNTGASAEKLSAIARPRGIAHPIRLFDVPTIPRGANGKVNRDQLKALLLASASRVAG